MTPSSVIKVTPWQQRNSPTQARLARETEKTKCDAGVEAQMGARSRASGHWFPSGENSGREGSSALNVNCHWPLQRHLPVEGHRGGRLSPDVQSLRQEHALQPQRGLPSVLLTCIWVYFVITWPWPYPLSSPIKGKPSVGLQMTETRLRGI